MERRTLLLIAMLALASTVQNKSSCKLSGAHITLGEKFKVSFDKTTSSKDLDHVFTIGVSGVNCTQSDLVKVQANGEFVDLWQNQTVETNWTGNYGNEPPVYVQRMSFFFKIPSKLAKGTWALFLNSEQVGEEVPFNKRVLDKEQEVVRLL